MLPKIRRGIPSNVQAPRVPRRKLSRTCAGSRFTKESVRVRDAYARESLEDSSAGVHVRQFIRTTPAKSTFKELFLGNKRLAHLFKVMSDRGAANKGLKDQECERGNRSKRPPIPYVPVVDEVQEKLAENNSEGRTFKITLANDTEFRAGVWFYGTPEQFLGHVKQALSALTRMGLFDDCKRFLQTVTDHRKKARSIKAEIATHKGSNDPDSKLAATALEGSLANEKALLKAAREASSSTAERLFSMYANLLSTEKRMAWDNIVERQCDAANWMDLKGVRHAKPRARTKKSFDDCVKHHVLSMLGHHLQNGAITKFRHH